VESGKVKSYAGGSPNSKIGLKKVGLKGSGKEEKRRVRKMLSN